jgi:type IV secretion system protein VirD4
MTMQNILPLDLARYAAPFLVGLATIVIALLIWRPYVLYMVDPNRDHYYRLSYTFLIAAPALFTLPLTALLPFHLRREVAVGTLAVFTMIAGFYLWQEYERVMPYFEAGWSFFQFIPNFNYYVIGGSVLGLVACAIQARLSINMSQDVKRVKAAAFGDADWMKMTDAGRLFPPDGGIVIGERYRVDQERLGKTRFDPRNKSTWGKGGTAPLLTFDGKSSSGHCLFFAGSGGFKTTSVVVPTALKWQNPLVCLDPSVEIAPMVIEHRTKTLGRKVHVLDPDNAIGFNVLDWIEDSTQKEQDIATVAFWLLAEGFKNSSGADAFFRAQTHNLLTGVIAQVMFSGEFDGVRTLRSVRNIISKSELAIKEYLKQVVETTESSFVRETLSIFTDMAKETFSGVHSNAVKDTQWLSFENYAALVSGDGFKSKDITTGQIDVFINLKTEVLQTYCGIARVIIGAFINAMMQANGTHTARTLFMLDEVNLLGAMKTLEIARDVGRKYGISLALIYQSIGQLKNQFGTEGKAAFFDSAAFVSCAVMGDLDAAREISALCGEITQEVQSSSQGTGFYNKASRRTRTTTMQKRPLIMPHEIIQDLRSDEQIILVKGQSPLRCGRALYFRRDDMNSIVTRNRFYRI